MTSVLTMPLDALALLRLGSAKNIVALSTWLCVRAHAMSWNIQIYGGHFGDMISEIISDYSHGHEQQQTQNQEYKSADFHNSISRELIHWQQFWDQSNHNN